MKSQGRMHALLDVCVGSLGRPGLANQLTGLA
jgi:hypothetical protein